MNKVEKEMKIRNTWKLARVYSELGSIFDIVGVRCPFEELMWKTLGLDDHGCGGLWDELANEMIADYETLKAYVSPTFFTKDEIINRVISHWLIVLGCDETTLIDGNETLREFFEDLV